MCLEAVCQQFSKLFLKKFSKQLNNRFKTIFQDTKRPYFPVAGKKKLSLYFQTEL